MNAAILVLILNLFCAIATVSVLFAILRHLEELPAKRQPQAPAKKKPGRKPKHTQGSSDEPAIDPRQITLEEPK